MPFGRVDGWVSGKNRDQFSMTQKHLKIAGDEAAVRRGGKGGNRRDPTVKRLLAFDSVEKTNQSTWFHGMWTAGKKVSALSLVAWSMESLMKSIFKRSCEIKGKWTIAALRRLQVGADLPHQREGGRRGELRSWPSGFTDCREKRGRDCARKLAAHHECVRKRGGEKETTFQK